MRFDPTLYVITDRAAARDRPLDEVVAAAIRGGATAIQLRDKEWSAGALVAAGRLLLALTRPAGIPLIVNDRVDVAIAIGAEGVHIGQDDLPAPDARRLLGPGMILGVSASNVEEAVAAESAGADYLGVGSIFATGTKPDAGAPIGPGALSPIRAAVRIPVVAIGGITDSNAAEALRAGADGVAVIAAVMAAADVEQAARALVEVIRDARR